MSGFTTVFTTAGIVTICDNPQVTPTTFATNTAAASPMRTYFPLLDVTVPVPSTPATINVTPAPTEISACDDTRPTIAYKATTTSSADAATVIVDTDETWEAEYLGAMKEAGEMKEASMSGVKKRCGLDGKKRCSNFCGQM